MTGTAEFHFCYDTDHRATMLFDEQCRVVDDPQAAERRVWQRLLQVVQS